MYFFIYYQPVEERTTASLSHLHISDISALIVILTLFNIVHFYIVVWYSS